MRVYGCTSFVGGGGEGGGGVGSDWFSFFLLHYFTHYLFTARTIIGSYAIIAQGATGGAGSYPGARMAATFTFVKGAVYSILVGQTGIASRGGGGTCVIM